MSSLICGPNPRICYHKPTSIGFVAPQLPEYTCPRPQTLPDSEIMAPHADDTNFDPEIPVPTKALPTNGDAQAQTASNGNAKEHTAAVSNGEAKETLESTHHASPSRPLQLKGVLNEFKSFDVTPVIGKEFPEAKLAEWLRAPNSDELIKDLAITSPFISHHSTGSSTDNCPTSLPTRCGLFPRSRRSR